MYCICIRAGTLQLNNQRLIAGPQPLLALQGLLSTRICSKVQIEIILSQNSVKISTLKSSCSCILDFYNKDKEKVLIRGLIGISYSVHGTRLAEKFEQNLKTSIHSFSILFFIAATLPNIEADILD